MISVFFFKYRRDNIEDFVFESITVHSTVCSENKDFSMQAQLVEAKNS